MGVTIHFEGKLKNEFNYENVINSAKKFAQENDMPYNEFDESDKLLLRVKDGEEWDYKGTTKGIRLQPHENSDPFILEFDKDYYLQEYCKTQFVNTEIHIKLINFLKCIESSFEKLVVFDEGGFWETNDTNVLETNINICFDQIELAKQKDKTLNGPFRIADGRIADLMHTT